MARDGECSALVRRVMQAQTVVNLARVQMLLRLAESLRPTLARAERQGSWRFSVGRRASTPVALPTKRTLSSPAKRRKCWVITASFRSLVRSCTRGMPCCVTKRSSRRHEAPAERAHQRCRTEPGSTRTSLSTGGRSHSRHTSRRSEAGASLASLTCTTFVRREPQDAMSGRMNQTWSIPPNVKLWHTAPVCCDGRIVR
jgi:hypothetical protein